MPKPKTDPVINCAYCGKRMTRKRMGDRLEDLTAFSKRKYCDRLCMAMGMMQESPSEHALHKRAQSARKDQCQICGATEILNVHHIDGNPKNNDQSNLMTLCASCHATFHWRNGKKPHKRQSVCKICGRPARKLDMCQKHYQRFRKYGDPYLTKKKIGSRFVLVRETPGTPNGWELAG